MSSRRAPRLDRQITFIQPVIATGDSNEDKVTDWEVIDRDETVWASMEDTSGTELNVNERLTYVQMTKWIIRFREDITTQMRLVYDTQVYEIIAMGEHEERRRYKRVMTNLLDNIFFT